MLNQVCVLTAKVDDIKKAVEFYTNVLSFKVSKYYGEKLVSLIHNEIPIVLEETEPFDTETRQSVLFGILSENLDKDVEALKAKGVELLHKRRNLCKSHSIAFFYAAMGVICMQNCNFLCCCRS